MFSNISRQKFWLENVKDPEPDQRIGKISGIQTQPGHVQRFCVILEMGLSLHPSSFDCVYNFSQASSQQKYTVTSTPGLRQCTHGPELPCVAGTHPHMTDTMYSLIRGFKQDPDPQSWFGHVIPYLSHWRNSTSCLRSSSGVSRARSYTLSPNRRRPSGSVSSYSSPFRWNRWRL